MTEVGTILRAGQSFGEGTRGRRPQLYDLPADSA
jgi:hypothetical protein